MGFIVSIVSLLFHQFTDHGILMMLIQGLCSFIKSMCIRSSVLIVIRTLNEDDDEDGII